jgi:Tfp pilus tip-associated adhesin PilY1
MFHVSRNIKIVFIAVWLIIFSIAGGVGPAAALTEYPCATGAAVPAFLTEGVDPNLLVIIDNSASMLDLAYVDDVSTCYDNTYNNGTVYAGYFDPETWYYTRTGLYPGISSMGYFYPLSGTTYCNTYDVLTGNDGTDDFVCLGNYHDFSESNTGIAGMNSDGMVNGELVAFDYFFATGNFLNWAAASKIDIQKEILTGGKYNATTHKMTMESRGCGGRRFVKEVAVEDTGGTTYYLTLGVTPPKEGTYDEWAPGTPYTAGDIVSDGGSTEYYIARYSNTSSTTAASVTEDTTSGIGWVPRFWKTGQYYPAGSIVSDPANFNTIDEGQMYITPTSGTSSGTSLANDSLPWERYDLTHIEIFTAGTTAFDNAACQDAIDALGSTDTAILGQLKQDIDDCLDYNRQQNQGDTANFNAAFNHSIHNCWYETKHGTWPPGAGPVNSMKPACEAIYDSGIQPWEITPDNPGYVCYGIHTGDEATDSGYVGRCWEPSPADCTWKCFKPNGDEVVGPTSYEECDAAGNNYDWEPVESTPPYDPCTAADWDPDPVGYTDEDDCIEQALMDFCGNASIPEVIDPSDQVGSDTGETETLWNIPAMLIDSGVVAQMGEPIVSLKGYIYWLDPDTTNSEYDPPEGLLQEFDDDIRMGAMTFNDNGSLSECGGTDPYVLYDCHTSNKDGGKVIAEIGQSSSHTDDLVEAINDIKATSWTPLAEAMFNAIGYYAQDTSFRLDAADFSIGTDPITAHCQDNNILIITEGASTADLNATMTGFAAGAGHNDTDASDADPDCGSIDGSTLLDDLAYYAKNDETVMGTMPDTDGVDQAKQNIATHIVVAGTLRSDGTGECSPETLLTDAAANGGTSLYNASDPSTLEATLREAFSAIRAGAAAGSAASVISASRGGEGATYQAIFFPTVELTGGGSVDWTGEVHALLVDSEGNLYEDSTPDRTLNTATDYRVIFFFDEDENKTKVCRNGEVSNGACSGTEIELEDVKYLWSAAQWLSQIPPVDDADPGIDITFNRASVPTPYATAGDYISGTKKRYVFTWNDLNNDGIVDDAELLDFDEDTDWAGLTVNSTNPAAASYRAPVSYDFGVLGADAAQTNDKIDEIVNWVRGQDQTGMRNRLMPYGFGGSAESDVYWRLGDVIHSTPISVASPSEGFHLLYRDSSYAEFVADYKARRHVIYYGGNDGMLHAVNGGFYDETQKKFCKTSDCLSESAAPDLGAELWAYVPYNLLGHLKCLTETDYTGQHKYYVDQRVRVFDMRIFDATDGIHTQGWGTVMVAAMRFGGAKIYPNTLDLDGNTVPDYPGDKRVFTSAYMVFDITDPERPPVLLAEMTRTTLPVWAEMGYTTPIPTAVTFKTGSSTSDTSWYLVFGSGPTELDGTSTQDAKIAVLPMDWLTGSTKRAFRIPNVPPAGASNQGGVFTISGSVFASDLVTVDFEIDTDYMSDAVYFGTLSGDWYHATANPDGWGGGLWRLVTRAIDGAGNQYEIEPSSWSLHHLIDTGQPVTASPTLGTDGKNFWVYFGTGRFLASDDKLDPETQSYYGIKEPMTFATDTGGYCVGTLTWATVEKTGAGSTPGDQGLTDVSLIEVKSDGTLSGTGIPSGVTTFDELVDHIAGTGTGCEGSPDHGTDGWVKDFQLDKERNIGQATLLGGLLTFTTYQPSEDECAAEGVSYLYGVYYQTGTAYSQGVFLSADNPEGIDASDDTVIEQVALGRGLATTPNLHVGKHEGSKAFVQTSTGEIVEVPQPNLPLESYKTGKISWGEVK